MASLKIMRSWSNYYNHSAAIMRFGTTTSFTSKQESSVKGELVKRPAREIFQRELPNFYQEGKFVNRISYVDFIDQALDKMKEFGLEKNMDAYKELLRVFPPGKYHPRTRWEFGLFHAPQQLAALRVLHAIDMNNLRPDKEIERLVVSAFSKRSDVWVKIARMNYWSMKGRNIDQNSLPEALPKEPHKLAKLALIRMLDDQKSVISVTNTSNLPDCVDKTWLVFSQSPVQKMIIDRLDSDATLYLEESGLTYVDDKPFSYFTLKYYVDDETRKIKSTSPEPDFNYNRVKVKFYGKPIKEKIVELEDIHYSDGSYILAIGFTGTSSQDSLLSMLKVLQQRNPNLRKLNVVFRVSKPTPELIEYKAQEQHGDSEQ